MTRTTETLPALRRALWAILLSFAWPAFADWDKIGNMNDDKEQPIAQVYVDPTTVRRQDDSVLAVILYSWNEMQQVGVDSGVRYRSAVQLQVFDCDRRAFAIHRFALHKEPMGAGDVVWKDANPEDDLQFNEVSPGSIGEIVLETVCGAASSPDDVDRDEDAGTHI
jgi:hypothetical protein